MERLIFKLSFMTSAGKTSPDLMGAPPPRPPPSLSPLMTGLLNLPVWAHHFLDPTRLPSHSEAWARITHRPTLCIDGRAMHLQPGRSKR